MLCLWTDLEMLAIVDTCCGDKFVGFNQGVKLFWLNK